MIVFFQGGSLSLPFIVVIDHRWVYRPAVGKMSADWPRNSMKLVVFQASIPKNKNMVRFSGRQVKQVTLGCTHGICNTISWEYTLGISWVQNWPHKIANPNINVQTIFLRQEWGCPVDMFDYSRSLEPMNEFVLLFNVLSLHICIL